jgi:hypothetical protein
MLYPDGEKGGRGKLSQVRDSLSKAERNSLSAARAILPHEDLVAQVMAEAISLNEAHEEARKREDPDAQKERAQQERKGWLERIQARAIRREGELFKQIEPAKGGDRRSDQRDAEGPLMSRKVAAEAAGISPRQMKTAIRVANLDPDEFEAAVESEEPPGSWPWTTT